MPILSVIIPVYNAERTLRECVDSVLQQDVKDFELILVDDGSKDASPVICDEYASKDNRVRVIHQQNAGVSVARNSGLEIAQGKWITFVDADDFILSNYFPDFQDVMTDLIICSYQKNQFDKIAETYWAQNYKGQEMQTFIKENISGSILRTPWAKFFRNSIINLIRFPVGMKVGEDSCFMFQYLAKCNNYLTSHNSIYAVRLSTLTNETKYGDNVKNALRSLQCLQLAFDQLNQKHKIGKDRFLHFIGYFKKISSADWGEYPSKWYRNKEVQALYKYVWPDLSFLQKLRLIVTFIIMKK